MQFPPKEKKLKVLEVGSDLEFEKKIRLIIMEH